MRGVRVRVRFRVRVRVREEVDVTCHGMVRFHCVFVFDLSPPIFVRGHDYGFSTLTLTPNPNP